MACAPVTVVQPPGAQVQRVQAPVPVSGAQAPIVQVLGAQALVLQAPGAQQPAAQAQEAPSQEQNAQATGAQGDVGLSSTSSDNEDLAALCVVCLVNVRNTVLVPCGHLCCMTCGDQLQSRGAWCPLCRGTITTICRIYF